MVRFDDRLQTVLRQPASDRHDAAVRWRQLVDLIARAGPAAESESVGQALAVIRSDASRLDEPLRAAAARSIAALPLPIGLLECFIADKLAVSAPILAAASLDTAQWNALLAGADAETRRFVEALHPELSARPADTTELLLVEPVEEVHRRTSISEVVERIERRRRAQEEQAPTPADAPPTPGASSVFRWECGPDGNIGWVEGAPRGALIGRSIAKAHEGTGDRIDQAALRAFAQRAPFRDANLLFAGDGAIAGRWKISGSPAFHPADGRFAGYRGIALRDSAGAERLDHGQIAFDGDSLRELVHEIRTPLNAIIGFAEIIDRQYLGPAGPGYRERATGIVGQAHILLAAIEDMDLIARARSAAVGPVSTDLTQIVTAVAEATRDAGGAALEVAKPPQPIMATIDGQSASRLIERLFVAVIELARLGEPLAVGIRRHGDWATVSIRSPRGLTEAWNADLGNKASDSADQPGRFGLRLAAWLARIAGAELTVGEEEVSLAFAAA